MSRKRRETWGTRLVFGFCSEDYGVTVKLVALVPVPPGVVTVMWPVTAPAGTSASTSVSVMTWKLVAATPPNFTAVVPVKLFPLIATAVPTGPLVGLKLEIDGTTAKVVGLLASPPGVLTVIFWPVFAPAGTVAVANGYCCCLNQADSVDR